MKAGFRNQTEGVSTLKFDAYELAREINRTLRPLLPRLKRADPDLFKQMRKAAASVPLNLAEGNRRLGGDRRHCFSIAFGSADEVRSILPSAQARCLAWFLVAGSPWQPARSDPARA